MKLLVILVLVACITFSEHFVSAAPKGKIHLALEQAMLNKLNKPWRTIDVPHHHARKGEFMCKGGICKTKVPCKDCQGPVPLDVNWEHIKH